MNTSFRRRLLFLVAALTSAVACAGLVVALLFERAYQQTVSLEERSGRILRTARELHFAVEQQRNFFVQSYFLPEGALRDVARASFAKGRNLVLERRGALQDAVQGDAELEGDVRALDAALDEGRRRIEAAGLATGAGEIDRRDLEELGNAAPAHDRMLLALIDKVRTRQSGEMSATDERLQGALARLAIGFLLVVIAIGVAVFLYLDRAFARPMGRSIRIAQDVAAGGLHARIPMDRNDEFGVFAVAFNRMLEELTGTQRRLESANEELESFSYTISHDLRAPLRSINGFAAMLREDAAGHLGPAELGLLERIEAASLRMGAMIQDVLEVSRIGRGELNCEQLDVSRMAADVLEELRAADPSRVVDALIEAGITAWGDAGLVRVVLDNLLGNAWKYTGRSAAARIEVLREGRGPESGFMVRDNGAGFDPAFASRLFRPFQRLHGQEEFEGTGVGLATVQRIVHRHGGRIEAQAQPGRGASFHVWLPAPAALAAG